MLGAARIANLNPTMVVIDSFSSIHKSLKFDENAAVAKHAVSQLEALSNTYGFGCILIHHNISMSAVPNSQQQVNVTPRYETISGVVERLTYYSIYFIRG
ncbi:MAG: AAA family ATPase [Stigonema ocellatum SAG 48.90 = DSM 106950]|nr:AAA family ATPase [Stigonema ocellatum SAG 48.90 = DSM 106950]